MDPWLERSWGAVHHQLISHLWQQIAPQLPDDLFTEVEETVYVLDEADGDASHKKSYRPDVAVFLRPDPNGAGNVSTALAEPEAGIFRVILPEEPVVEGYIEIRQLSEGNPLVTAIEVLSPTNKSTAIGKTAYLHKRRAYRDS